MIPTIRRIGYADVLSLIVNANNDVVLAMPMLRAIACGDSVVIDGHHHKPTPAARKAAARYVIRRTLNPQ